MPTVRYRPVARWFLAGIVAIPLHAQFTQQTKLIGTSIAGTSGATQGDSVALSSDGSTLVVGGATDNNFQGAVWVFTRVSGAWNQQGGKLLGNNPASSPNPRNGFAVAVSADGNTLIEGARTASAR